MELNGVFNLFLFLYYLFLSICLPSSAQLVVNVRNSGGEVVQEIIGANTTEETVKLEFQRPDGSLITQLIDFASEIQIFRMITMAEEEKGQRADSYQVICQLYCFLRLNICSIC